jgi:gamma-glutamylcyclotransferase (GGCT)/AIG2-like uncharacterized protein YtfP
MTLYFAYGSNLNLAQMKRRCPMAQPIGSYTLHDSRLVFRSVADCIYEKDSVCHGSVYKITPQCERTLDGFEGVGAGTYRKEYIPLIEPFDGDHEMLVYVMNSEGIYPPSQEYLDRIIQGYRDFELPLKPLREAVKDAWKHKNPSWRERQRLRRNGPQPLGLSKTVTNKTAAATTAAPQPIKPPEVGPATKKVVDQWSQPDFFDWSAHGVVYGD